MWREVKRRVSLSIENVKKGEFARPYRMTVPERNCGFVFVPVPPEISASPDWSIKRLQAIQNFMLAHKYDQRLPKCIGVQVSKDGEYFDIYWGLVAFPWEYDPDMQEALTNSFPFRPVEEGIVHGYRLAKE